MASKEVPLSELLMQEPDPQIVDLTSPLNSVDNTSKDRVFIQEGWWSHIVKILNSTCMYMYMYVCV